LPLTISQPSKIIRCWQIIIYERYIFKILVIYGSAMRPIDIIMKNIENQLGSLAHKLFHDGDAYIQVSSDKQQRKKGKWIHIN